MVAQRLARVLDQRGPLFRRQPFVVDVEVVGGDRDQREHLAGLHVEHDCGGEQRCADVPLENLLHACLQLEIDREHQAVARDGVLGIEHAQLSADRVDLDLSSSRRPAQHRLVARLQARLTDLVAVEVALSGQFGVLLLGDPVDVAQDVREQLGVRIAALGDRLDHDAGQLAPARGQIEHYRVSRIVGDHEGQEGVVAGLAAENRLLDLPARHLEDRGDLRGDPRFLAVGYVGGDERDAVGGYVLDQPRAVAVVDQPPRGREVEAAYAVDVR